MIDEMTTATFQGFALSPQQVRLWQLRRLFGGTGAAGAIRIEGDLDPARLRAAVTAAVARHEILRTGFQALPGMTTPIQVIAAPEERPPVWEDAVGNAAGKGGVAELLARFLAARPVEEPPLRLALAGGGGRHILLMALHPLCGDASTLAVLTAEIARTYAGEEPAGEPMQYADYAAWQNDVRDSTAGREDAGHWSRQGDLAEPLSLALPFERRDAGLSPSTARLRLAVEGVERAAEPWLLAVWLGWLARYTGQTRLAVAVESAGRDFAELAGACGPFARSLPVVAEIDEDRPPSDLAGALAAALAAAREHQDGFVWPEGAFPAWSFVLETPPLPVASGGLVFTLEDWTAWSERSVLSLVCRPGEGRLGLELRFDAARIEPAEAERVLRGLAALIRDAAAAPDVPLGDLAGLPDEERERVLAAPNRTRRDLAGADRCLHELVADRAARAPDAVAIRWEGGTLTFAELERRAGALARRMLARGVGREARVAVLVERSPEMVVALLGILKAGAAWISLDPDHPEGRLAAILEDSAPALAVTRSELAGRLPADLPRVLVDAPEAEGSSFTVLPVSAPDQLAYVIHTSGSTGRPKGVQVSHRAILNRLLWMQDAFPLAPDDRVLQKTPYGFDASIWEIFCPLLAGAELVLARPGGHQDVGYLAATVARQGITVLQLVPSLLGPFLEEPAAAEIRSLRRLFCGGEALTPELVHRFFARFDAGLCNLYGPTEAAIDAAFRVCEPGMQRVPIGRALPNVRLFVMNRRLRPLPLGAPGELLIGGVGLARGYLGRPDWTAERFLPDPWSGQAGARLYRTGDLVRRLPDGELEYLGRIDRQVKVRGVRIELREVEALLATHPDVREAVVVMRGRGGESRLIAYAVPVAEAAGSLTPAALREHLAGRLPASMIPGAFVVLRALPLTPNGKLDWSSLPEPETAAAAGDGEPGTPGEQILAGIWAEVLGHDRVGIHQSFFDLGGHSLSATQVVSRVRKAFGIDLRVQTLFDEPTVAGLAREVDRAIRAGSGVEAPPIVAVPRDRPLPLSFAQQRLWFLQRLYPESSFYNLPMQLAFRGDLHLPSLRRSLSEIVRRHESLRTTFHEGDDGEPVQVIGPPVPSALPLIDLAGLPRETAEAELARLVVREVARPFDLSTGPLLRALLLRRGERDHVGLLNLHHIVTDAWSTTALTRELSALYPAFLRGEPSPLPELPLQYADFACWQRGWLHGAALEAQIAWWHEHLREAPPALELPGDRPRPEVQTFRGATTSHRLAEGLGDDLADFSRRHGVTLFMTLLAACNVLLRWWTGQSDLVVGTDVASRNRSETEGLIGFFINQLALRTDLSGDPAFTGLLEQVRETTLGAYAHDDLPFDRLVASLNPERSRKQSPVFQVKVSLHNVPAPPLEMPGLAAELLPIPRETTQSDLILNFRHDPPSLLALADYSTDLFEEATILRLLGQLEALLAHVLEHPEAAVSDLCEALSRADELKRLALNQTAAVLPGNGLLHAAVEAQAARTPDKIAVRRGETALTWAELMRWSGDLAGELRRLGVGPEVPVAVCAERSPEMVVALLGILQAGGAYVPLDPDHPVERSNVILDEVRPPVLVSRGDLPPGLDPGAAARVRLDRPLPARSGDEKGEAPGPDNLAYILYTSGSTGRPKGVQVSHRAIANRVLWMQEAFPLAPDDRVLQKTPYGFDASIWEIFLPLAVGAELVLARPGGHQDAAWLVRAVAEERITILQLVPTLLRAFLDEPGVERCASLRRVFCGGEELSTDLAVRFASLLPAELGNLYGPTETAIDATSWSCRDGVGQRSVPIGRPIANLQVFLLDRDARPVPFGSPGEPLVGGVGLARGYFGRPDLTAARFVPHPYGQPGERLYRTGDLARHLPGGELEYLGRADRQIKLRGVRIEPGEIEVALRRHPGVRDAVVTARPLGTGGSLRLVAHVVPRDPRLATAGLRDFLAERLPLSMVPSLFVSLPELPRNANGKLDLNALPDPAGGTEPGRDAPRSESEELLASLWAELLGRDRVGVHDNFFELGGHSLLATQLVSRVRQRLGVDLPLHALFDAPTVAGLARELDAAVRGGEAGTLSPIERVPRSGGLPLSFAQQRLWFYERRRPGTAVFNILVTFRLQGALRIDLLARAFTEVVRRHEILRTTFPDRSGLPVQQVGEPWAVPLPVVDLAALSPAAREAETARLALAEGERSFDLAAGPLLRLLLLRSGPDEHVLPFSVHHIVSDAWSSGLLTRELAALYRAFAAGEPSPLHELSIQYADFAAWQQRQLAEGALAPQIAYWKKRLAGAPPRLDLPADRPRPEAPSYRGLTRPVALPAHLSERLEDLGLRQGATPFMVLLAALQVLLRKITGQDDLVVGTDVAGRNRVEVEGLLGFFVNQLALRTDLSGDPTFAELLARVRKVTLGAYAHQDAPFEHVVDVLKLPRTLSHAPVFQVKLFVDNSPPGDFRLPGLTFVPLELETEVAKLDLTLAFWQRGGVFQGWINYNTDLFDSPRIERMLGHYQALLEAVAERPGARLSELDRVLSEIERKEHDMEKKDLREMSFKKFKAVAPKAVVLPQDEVVERTFLAAGQELPLVLRPLVPDLDLADWAAAHREGVEADLLRYGAILFRGFGLDTPETFERFAGTLCPDLFNENGEHPRESVSGNVYTPVFYPEDQQLLWHNENSFNWGWPRKIFFACARSADAGGETPIVDSRRVYREIPAEIRERFERLGVMYQRNYSEALGLHWKTVFQVDDKGAVEKECREDRFDFEWRDGDRLRTRALRPGVVRHPVTGEPSWFNQAQHWHVSCLDPETSRAMRALFPDDGDLPRHCSYGDGSPISDAEMDTILDVYRRLEVSFPWQRGDVLMLDNVLTAHGRNPFKGQRKILVALGQMTTYSDLQEA